MRFRLNYGVLRDPDPNPAGGGAAAIDYSKLDYSKLDYTKFDLAKLDVTKLVPILTPHLAEALKPKPDEKPEGKPEANPGETPPDARFTELQKNHTTLQTKFDAMTQKMAETERRAEEKDRGAQIQGIMSEFTFASPEAAAAAKSYFLGQVARVKDGEALVGPDGTMPFDTFLRESLSGPQSFFLAPKNVSGAGAGNPGGGNKALDIDNIKPGMSADDMRAFAAQIAALQR